MQEVKVQTWDLLKDIPTCDPCAKGYLTFILNSGKLSEILAILLSCYFTQIKHCALCRFQNSLSIMYAGSEIVLL